MKGISTRGTYTLDLEQVFIEVRIDPTPAHQASSDPIRLPSELRHGTHDIWDYLTRPAVFYPFSCAVVRQGT